ncbi:TPA: AAA family ATPase [Pseudomonas aeruginosa]|nr:AAA family ATPase [Pseudomonas aeruginosa]
MYLKTLTVSNFRSIEQLEIPLCNDLTILVGENNGGKSNPRLGLAVRHVASRWRRSH